MCGRFALNAPSAKIKLKGLMILKKKAERSRTSESCFPCLKWNIGNLLSHRDSIQGAAGGFSKKMRGRSQQQREKLY